ncbi:chaplin [Streptomyces sp. ISL-36]|uniref:chaplin n=1 Tax=Streptomyces sp. ISL-36 TaxID=2819182 RepID=UPI001BE6FEE1|nr:chaplin [Streptomyces sp. ISL-36]MBT2445101.1 chaplin [Streptomyces sp. ISL-36]
MRKRIFAAVTLAAAVVLGGSSTALADPGPGAFGVAAGSPGIVSGNVIQVPIHVPINLCGNTIDIVGLLNPTFGNTCVSA